MLGFSQKIYCPFLFEKFSFFTKGEGAIMLWFRVCQLLVFFCCTNKKIPQFPQASGANKKMHILGEFPVDLNGLEKRTGRHDGNSISFFN